jgi:5-oxoprolinase (ATP-hydrolysing) subunit A
MALAVALNADVGESFGAWRMGNDEALLPLIDSANIACGFHGGDPLILRKTLRLAKAAGIGVGAHPSFPDLAGFGRRFMALSGEELEACIAYQLAAFSGMARQEGLAMDHVKPHGALNNAAAADRALADVVVRAIKAFDPGTVLLAPALSHLAAAGRAAGLAVVDEIFADRTYMDDAQLTPRSRPDAMVHDASHACAHVLGMLKAGAIVTLSGKHLPTPIGSVCVHGDGPEAVATARVLRGALAANGVTLAPLRRQEAR